MIGLGAVARNEPSQAIPGLVLVRQRRL